MEFLEIPLIDDDFYKMMMRFVINIFFLTIVIRFLYYIKSRRKDYLLTYYMISTIVFFLCFTLKKFELDVGMALGLFAIFGILRYRTNPVDVREMTYLFIVIGVSVINALANKKMSYAEILTANIIVVTLLTGIENYWILKQEVTKEVVYEKIENIKKSNIQKAISWCDKFKVPYNNFTEKTNIFLSTKNKDLQINIDDICIDDDIINIDDI